MQQNKEMNKILLTFTELGGSITCSSGVEAGGNEATMSFSRLWEPSLIAIWGDEALKGYQLGNRNILKENKSYK